MRGQIIALAFTVLACSLERSGAALDRGAELHAAGRHQAALTAYNEAVQLSPTWAIAHLERGHELAELGRVSEAREAYQKALELEPSNLEAKTALTHLDSTSATVR